MIQKRLSAREIDVIAQSIIERENNVAQRELGKQSSVRTRLIVGNWKMNLGLTEADTLLHRLARQNPNPKAGPEIVVAPPFVYLERARRILPDHIAVAAQNVGLEAAGAYTGEVSYAMLKDLKTQYVILGHSERRSLFHETGAKIARKAIGCLQAGLTPIICIGETLEEREGNYLQLLESQLLESILSLPAGQINQIVLAYEPVWAIGTGVTASPLQAQEVHAFLRKTLEKNWSSEETSNIRILYGGSVNAGNACELLNIQEIDGALVGGASLKADAFATICA